MRSIKILKGDAALLLAYRDGYDEFEGFAEGSGEDFDFGHFTETARWANNIAPSLRALSGYSDGGHGTYQIEGDVAVLDAADADDVPADADVMRSSEVYDRVVDAYREGAHDAVSGSERTGPEGVGL